MRMIRFDDRVAIVTGAGKGLGRAYALELARRGARLVLNNRRREVDHQGLAAVDHLAAEIRAAGGEAVVNADSVEDPASGPRMVAQALDQWGRLDVVVNNAGVDRTASFAKMTLSEYLNAFEINFHGSLYLAHAAWGPMREVGYGRIVMSTSSAGLHGGHGLSSYAAAKAALIGLTRSLAVEGRSRGVLVNAIAPYAFTPMTAPQMPPELADRFPSHAVAPLVAWLASEANTSISGECFVAGGGRFQRAASVEGSGVLLAGSDNSAEGIGTHLDRLRTLEDAQEFVDAMTAFSALSNRLDT